MHQTLVQKKSEMTRDVGTSASARHPDVTALFADFSKKREGVPEMGTKPLKAPRGISGL